MNTPRLKSTTGMIISLSLTVVLLATFGWSKEQDRRLEQVMRAARVGDVPTILKWLKTGGSINACGGRPQRTLLATAAEYNQVHVIEMLLQRGALVDAPCKTGATPLMWAAWNGHLDAIRILLKAGANPLAIDRFGRTLLYYGVHSGNLEVVRMIVTLGVDINREDDRGSTALHIAALDAGNPQIVQYLIARGANINAFDRFNGYTPLMHAILSRDIATVKVLLDARAMLDFRDRYGRTPLDLARQQGDADIIRLLEERTR